MEASEILIYISAISILLPLIIGLSKYRSLPNGEKIFLSYLAIAALFESLFVYMMLHHMSSHLIGNLFVLSEFILISLVLTSWLKEFSIKIPSLIVIGCFIIVWSFNATINGLGVLSQYVITAERLGLMILSGYFLIQLMRHFDVYPFHNRRFWIASGIFIYFTTTILTYSMLQLLSNGSYLILTKYFNYFNTTINIFGNILYSIGFLCKLPKVK